MQAIYNIHSDHWRVPLPALELNLEFGVSLFKEGVKIPSCTNFGQSDDSIDNEIVLKFDIFCFC